jgi:dTDP-4-amino-4,6-dideoxygalactose transaminase
VIPITRPELPPLEQYTALLEEVWSSRMLSNFGPFAQRLEVMTTEYLGVDSRVVVSGDIGLTLTIAALGLPKGASCLVPSFTFNSTINAALWNGLRPVFVDIDPETLNMDATDARRAAAEAGDARLTIATHVFGNPADADALRGVADEFGMRLIFDAAHGYGAIRDGAHVGQLGDAEVFSLSGTKPVTSAEGGLISSRDPELLDRIRLLRGYGFLGDYNSRLVGLNGKMSEFHAALGLLTMRRVEDALAIRHGHVRRYHQALAGIPGIAYQQVRPDDRSTYKDFALLFDDETRRNHVEASLAAAGIQTKRYFKPCHQMDAFRIYGTRPLPVTEAIYGRILCIPLFEALTGGEIEMIGEAIRRALEGAAAGRG